VAVPFARGLFEQDRATKSAESPAVKQLKELHDLTDEQLFAQYESAKASRISRDDNGMRKDYLLTELVRRGGKECEKWLKAALDAETAKREDSKEDQFTLRSSLQVLAALRRVQKKSDPVVVEVRLPDVLRGDTRELPTLQVALTNVDDEKLDVVMMQGGDYRSGRQARWRLEVHDAKGQLLPQRKNRGIMGGGMFGMATLRHGDSWPTQLPMDSFVQITEPGEYTVRVLYHASETIADRDDVTGLIMCVSKRFKLQVGKAPKKVLSLEAGSRTRAKDLIAALAEKGRVKVVMGGYTKAIHDFIDPQTPEGQLLTMGWQAVPELLDTLSDERISTQKRGWLLALLFAITGERDLNPFDSLRGGDKPHNIIAEYEYRSIGRQCSGSSYVAIDAKEQRAFAQKWLKFKEEHLDIRETQ
jgi:hypothetical protein